MNQGADVDVYILDSGVDITNPLLSKVHRGTSFLNEWKDLSGHGSHVAGIISSVAPKANIIDVRVLGQDNNGSTEYVSKAILWVIGQAQISGRRSVINLSLGSPKNEVLAQAVQQAYESGIFVIGAAGNKAEDACKYAPADSPYVLSVASSSFKNKVSPFSNLGECVGIFAPGSQITSTWLKGETKALSGTSMASPHIAAIAALLLGEPEMSSWMMDVGNGYNLIKQIAGSGQLHGNLNGTTNLLAFNGRSDYCWKDELNKSELCYGVNQAPQ
jgi:subtilisin family serine protease